MIWSDTNGGAGMTSSKTPNGMAWDGKHTAHDGRRIDFKCQSADGKTGSLTVNGTPYDLGNGALFLVTSKSGKVEVRQLKRDLSKFGGARDEERWAKGDADVSAFLAGTK
jgi:hypothetical protein